MQDSIGRKTPQQDRIQVAPGERQQPVAVFREHRIEGIQFFRILLSHSRKSSVQKKCCTICRITITPFAGKSNMPSAIPCHNLQ